MYAIVKTGGKQYRVAEGDVIEVEKLVGDPGDSVSLAAVLLEKETLDREEVEKFFGDIEKRLPREAEERSAGLAVTRAAQKKRERRPTTPGTLGDPGLAPA